MGGILVTILRPNYNLKDRDTDNVTNDVPDNVPNKVTDKVVDKVPNKVPDNGPDKRQALVLELIKKNNQILLKELAITLKVSNRTIRRDIEKLKKMNKLKRIGSEKAGHWKITDEHPN